jgi:hypothetical protein
VITTARVERRLRGWGIYARDREGLSKWVSIYGPQAEAVGIYGSQYRGPPAT